MAWKSRTLITLLGATLVGAACSQGKADSGRHDEHERDDRHQRNGWLQYVSRDDDRRTRLVTADSPVYRDECGSCHLAYPPGLLGTEDWQRVFDNLADHYGDNASLAPGTEAALRDFVAANAGSGYGTVSAGGAVPRITTTRWFVREHDEMPARMVAGNPQVGSYANCTACHTRAEAGSYREREIIIPGFGRWDD